MNYKKKKKKKKKKRKKKKRHKGPLKGPLISAVGRKLFPFCDAIIAYHHLSRNQQYKWSVCSYHVTYAFQSEPTLYNCQNVKELLAWNRRNIWRLSECNGTRTHNHLVNHLAKLAFLAKWLSVRLWTKWLWVWVPLQSLNIQEFTCFFVFGKRFCIAQIVKWDFFSIKIMEK